MDRTATLTSAPVEAPTVDDSTVEPSAEPPVQYPLDDEERNLVDLVEHELVVED